VETHFTPVEALAGGALIGVAVMVLFLNLGRIAGVSGMFTAAIRASTSAGERAWRLAFLVGLLAGPLAAAAVLDQPLVRPSPASLPVLVLAGLAVGLGTGLANGCTSGHGVCGIGRLSVRSFAAVGIFMAAGMAATYFMRHVL
jgi:uncharacterized protein